MQDGIKADIEAVQRIESVPLILEVVCRTTGMGFAAVARVTEDRWVCCAVRDEIAFGLEPGGELQIETTICHEIRQSHQAVVIDHVAEDATFRNHHTPAQYGFQSYISVPIMRASGEMFGTLCAIDPRPALLSTPHTIATFKLFAELIGSHLDALDRLQASEADLRDERHTAGLREQFIAVLGHDLRNPLAAIDAGTRVLSRAPERAPEVLDLMRNAVKRMSGLIDDVMDFTRGWLGDGLSLRKRSVQLLLPVIEQVVSEARATAPDRRIELEADLAVPVNCDAGRVAQVLSNLLANAVTYGAPDQPIRVVARSDAARFELSVANAGEPIPAAALLQLFQPFYRGQTEPAKPGLGLGLYIASEIARAHGGTLTASSTPQETRFVFSMPVS
ncbi:GAF domain-containing sensor histidine kinase [Rhodopseudomonas palustris]|uniref:histidine kinase n=1 Tax=Rhodopseudomonas palustris TaxID=1076 RepID=A0A418VLX8_RHOPL|nr:GAF domain-containing sensor histidine kinase [Rhodopseudomonas palustris]RJF77181.1 GAF domain-containing protein [Rhodopseudomonas palustris]